jgi:hypothetical protein
MRSGVRRVALTGNYWSLTLRSPHTTRTDSYKLTYYADDTNAYRAYLNGLTLAIPRICKCHYTYLIPGHQKNRVVKYNNLKPHNTRTNFKRKSRGSAGCHDAYVVSGHVEKNRCVRNFPYTDRSYPSNWRASHYAATFFKIVSDLRKFRDPPFRLHIFVDKRTFIPPSVRDRIGQREVEQFWRVLLESSVWLLWCLLCLSVQFTLQGNGSSCARNSFRRRREGDDDACSSCCIVSLSPARFTVNGRNCWVVVFDGRRFVLLFYFLIPSRLLFHKTLVGIAWQCYPLTSSRLLSVTRWITLI